MISVIIPAYNAQGYLRECLESVLAQSFTDWECVVVNDGSTDSTPDIVRQYAASDSRFRLVSKPNGGQAEARNCGIEHSHGEWMTFLDADDCLYPGALAFMHNCAALTGADVVAAGISRTLDALIVTDTSVSPKVMSGLQAAEETLYQSLGFDGSACAKLIRRSLTDRCRFTPGIWYEDLEYMSRLYPLTPRVAVCRENVYFYRDNGTSFINTFSLRRLDVLRVTRLIVERVVLSAPSLLPAALDRQLSAAFNIYGLLARYSPGRDEEMQYCWDIIRSSRRASLFNRRVRLKNKAGILLSYLGPSVLRRVMRLATR